MNFSPFVILVLTLVSLARASHVDDDDWIETETDVVFDYRNNPILRPTEALEWLMGDPTVLLIEERQELHMFLNEVFHGILHFSANYTEPSEYKKEGTVIPFPGAVRPYVLREGDKLYLYYEQYHLPLYRRSSIMVRTADIVIKETGWINNCHRSSDNLAPRN